MSQTVALSVCVRDAARVTSWLAGNTDLSVVAAALVDRFGVDPLAHRAEDRPGVALWNTTGTDDRVRADVGHVEAGGRPAGAESPPSLR